LIEQARDQSIGRVLDYLTRVEDAMVEERRPGAHGTALLTPSLPLVWQLNALRAEDPEAGAVELAAEAEAQLAGLGHRKVLVHDEARGVALAPGFSKLGWHVYRLLVLALRRPPERLPEAGAGAEVDAATGSTALRAFRREQPFGRQPEAVRQLGEMDERLARAIGNGRFFAAPPQRPASACRLYVDGSLAQIDEVGTVKARRGQGHASAAVLAAAGAAEADGCELIFLLTDADDWPRRWYRRLGFDELGAVYEFLKLPLGELRP
jgi:ribosomal protein S18 acetylase RimI-like enzyme